MLNNILWFYLDEEGYNAFTEKSVKNGLIHSLGTEENCRCIRGENLPIPVGIFQQFLLYTANAKHSP